MSKHGSATVSARLVVLLVLLGATTTGTRGEASASPDNATQVGYIKAPVGSSVTWQVQCTADDPSVKAPHAIASGVVYPDWMPGQILYIPRTSGTGTTLAAGGQQITFEPRQTDHINQSSGFSAGGSWSSGDPADGVAYVIWALWGSTATCTGNIDGQPRPVTYLNGTHAFLAGPESFHAGFFAQSGGHHASAGRTFTGALKGGPTFAQLSVGEYGLGELVTDADVAGRTDCRQPTGGTCAIRTPSGSELTATILGAYESTGGSQGELIVITLPPGA
ncbi:MAG TPA: hypothetical protein VGB83_04095 [Actinomycetota bacterium]